MKYIKWNVIPKCRSAVDNTAKKIAWLLPKRVVMWAFIRVGAHATTGAYSHTVVPELPMMDALKRWETV